MRKITVGNFRLDKTERDYIEEIMDSNWISEGKFVRRFEEEWAKYIGTKFSVVTNSGTSALIAAIFAVKHKYGIKDGSKVLTTPLTYNATVNAIVHNRLEPAFADIRMDNYCIDADKMAEFFEKNPDTKLTVPVHLMGFTADMDSINAMAKKYGCRVIEDAAESNGSVYKGKMAGSLSDASIFSFYVSHNIQAGELGAINTSDREIMELVKRIKVNGEMIDDESRAEGNCELRFKHDLIGYNFKAMEFQAAFALAQIKKAGLILKKRQENVRVLNDGLRKYDHILQLPEHSGNYSYLAYPLLIKKPQAISRKKLTVELEKRGIQTRPLFHCIPTRQPAYMHMKKQYERKLPNAEYASDNGFYIGVHQFLSGEDVDYVVKSFREVLPK
ncbi:DegT/DnrJ/EryC1/StrS family aminotransferase [Candidatus Woesearchaeota archaeon]|nr:DegT/DnrJ/EryC1/StrS family aminotransferase [Candidatus Woesearchaeota archaeon]